MKVTKVTEVTNYLQRDSQATTNRLVEIIGQMSARISRIKNKREINWYEYTY